MSTTKAARAKAPAWTQAKADDARDKQRYIKAAKPGGFLAITGAEKQWKAQPDFVYVPHPYQVAGTPNEIIALFTSLDPNLSRQQVDAIIAQGYSLANTGVGGSLRAAYEAEVGARNQATKQKPVAAKPTITLSNAMAVLNSARVEPMAARRKPAAKKAAAKASPGGQRGARQAAVARLAEASESGLLDVSNTQANGTGTKLLKEALGPKTTKRRPVAALPIVSSKREGWVNFLNRLAAEDAQYAQYINAFDGNGRAASPRAASPHRTAVATLPVVPATRAISPPRTAVATLPVVPAVRATSPSRTAVATRQGLPNVPVTRPFPTGQTRTSPNRRQ